MASAAASVISNLLSLDIPNWLFSDPPTLLIESAFVHLSNTVQLGNIVREKIQKVEDGMSELKSKLENDKKGRQLSEQMVALERHSRDILHEFPEVKKKLNEVHSVLQRGFFIRLFWVYINALEIIVDIEEFHNQIVFLNNKFNTTNPVAESQSSDETNQAQADIWKFELPKPFVERSAEMEQMRSLMSSDDPNSLVIAVYGRCGLGKTVLSWKLYQEAQEQKLFQAFAWVNVSQLGLGASERILDHVNEQLERQIDVIEDKRRCLIVLNDLWFSDDLVKLHSVFSSAKTGSKILITTQVKEVAESVPSKIHRMGCLTEDEGQDLISRILPSKITSLPPEEFKQVGKKVVEWCQGLPFAVAESVKSALKLPNTAGNHELFAKITQEIGATEAVLKKSALSFNNLPYFLVHCFLYMGLCEEDSRVDVEKLYLLLLADRHILLKHRQREEIPMNVAERYLYDLEGRNMIEVQEAEVPTMTRIESCILNPFMRQLCHQKSKEQPFFKVLDLKDQSEGESDSKNEIYRVSINLNNWGEDSELSTEILRNKMKHIRCMLLSVDGNQILKGWNWPKVLYALFRFKNLKILIFTGFPFDVIKLPYGIENLLWLRYLSFKDCRMAKLPSSIRKLNFLEILDLRVKNKMVIPNVLQKLSDLKHLYFPWSFQTERQDKLRLVGLKKLETITNLNTEQVNVEDLYGLSSLYYMDVFIPKSLNHTKLIAKRMSTKIGIRCLHASIKIHNLNFYTDEGHSVLKQLWRCPSLVAFDMTGCIRQLPQIQGINSKLAKIVLVRSELVEDSMETLNRLPMLRVLVMEDGAYMGKKMTCSALGFKELRRLELSNLPNLKEWIVEDGAMPKISKLVIRNCGKLVMKPEGLGFVRGIPDVLVSGIHDEFKESLGKVGDHIKYE